MSKKTPKHTAQTEHDDDTGSSMGLAMLVDGLGGLRAYVAATSQAIRTSHDADAASDFAQLLTRIATALGELRKAEKAARSEDSEYTAPAMLDRIRRMSTAERQQFARAVAGLNADAGKSGLA